MDEAKLALEVTKGIKGLFQDIIAPDVKAIIALLISHTELLKEHGQKMDKISEDIRHLDVMQGEILARLDLEKRISTLEKTIAEIKG